MPGYSFTWDPFGSAALHGDPSFICHGWERKRMTALWRPTQPPPERPRNTSP